jgi:integrase
MPIYKRPKSPYLWVKVQIAGQTIRRSSQTADRREAEEFEQQLRSSTWRAEKLGDRGATPFSEAATKWLKEPSKRRRKEKTDGPIVDWFLGQKEIPQAPLNSFDDEAIGEIRELLGSTGGRDGKGRSHSTVDRHMNVFRAIMRRAVKPWKWLTVAPDVPMWNDPEEEAYFLTQPQYARLIKEMKPHMALAAEFAVRSLLRMTPMLKMTWDKIDLARKHAWVPGRVQKNGNPKPLHLTRDMVKILMKARTLSPEGDHVFQYEGHPIGDLNTAAFKKAVVRAGLDPKKVKWHTFRHTGASWGAQNKVTSLELMEVGGWASERMVKRYAHLNADSIASASETISAAAAGGKRRVQKRHTA